jgi:AraC-like DNA-binding protein
MDVLSDVITLLRTGEPRSARLEFHGPWGQWFAPFPGSAGFHVILQGPCWLLRPPAEPVALGVGDVVFRPHGGPHALADSAAPASLEPACRPDDARRLQRYASDTIGSNGTSVTVTLCGAYELERAFGHPLLEALPEVVHLPAHLGRNPGLRSTVDLLAAELAQPRLGSDAIIPALLDTLLLYVLRTWFDAQPASTGSTGWAAALNDPGTVAALRAIHDDPARPWTVAALAAEAGLSRAPFARRFAALLGQPPLTYLTWWRMTTAARLLRESDQPLNAVAARVGYASEFAFSAAFKRRHGVAPGRFRRAGALEAGRRAG